MITRLIRHSFHAPLLTALLVAAGTLIGGFWMRDLPRDVFPDLSAPVFNVIAQNPAMGAEELETAIAIPLGILGALYTSQLMDPRLQRWIKPSVEIMASLPSVVLGFLAGLWLAPRVDRLLPAMMLMLFVLPLAVVGEFRAGEPEVLLRAGSHLSPLAATSHEHFKALPLGTPPE